MEKMSPTVRNALGQALKLARFHRNVELQQLTRLREEVEALEVQLDNTDERIADLYDALGDEEASRWEA